jgi:hypothetical protein
MSSKIEQDTPTCLPGLSLLQLLPSLFQGGGKLPPDFQILLERMVRSTLLLDGSEFSLFDIGQFGTALLGTGQVVGRPASRFATGAQITFDQRTGTHSMRLQKFGFDSATLALQGANLGPELGAGVGIRHVSVISRNH